MSDQLLIYLIVALNVACQLMLIWRQKFTSGVKWKFCWSAVAIPVAIMLSMRLLIANGTIHGHVAEQTLVEQYFTKGTSVLLIAGPWLVTFTAIMTKLRNRTLLNKQVVN